ncbi:hypothetical protein LE181_05790 [Streptomyces sp. SCA3-4]|uniref:hypothetical protein n=1 Tax=Streptomyces sichuanensis TaxID=2871810 RepID=UPI001CE2B5F9|nr:hypothetical protein [Streptomyces sichuanensis]MCA6091676.1 hypothetical protein [Streptomyces sichuanensis]
MKAAIAPHTAWTWSMTKVATAAFMVETALAWAGLWMWEFVRPTPVPEGEAGPESPALAVFALPVLLPLLAAASLCFVCTFVLPTTVLARQAGTRWGGAGAWWWVPPASAVVTAFVVAVVGAATGLAHGGAAAPAVHLWWWLGLTAATVPVALVTRHSHLRGAAGREPLRARTVLGAGCGGVAALFTGVGLVVAALDAVFG